MKKFLFLVLPAAILLVVGNGNSRSAFAQPRGRVLWQLNTDKDYQGPVQRSVVDFENNVVYLAALTTLYGVREGRVEEISKRPEKEARLLLAPGGDVYAWLLPDSHGHGLFYIRLFNISGGSIAELRLRDFPYGFNAFYMGFKGRILVTASPLDDREGIGGRFQYTFWNRQGEMLKKITMDGQQTCVLDAAGTTILFLGKKEAVAYSGRGDRLWGLPGRFRKAAVTREGGLALLNPSSREEINQVHVYRGGSSPRIVRIDTPVHGLTLTPDGSSAVVVGDQGRYFFLDPSTLTVQEGRRLQSIGLEGVFYITNLRFVNPKMLAMGILHRQGEPPKATWPRSTILFMDREGNVAFRTALEIRRATAFDPKVEVAFGSRFIVAYTEETALLIDLEQ